MSGLFAQGVGAVSSADMVRFYSRVLGTGENRWITLRKLVSSGDRATVRCRM